MQLQQVTRKQTPLRLAITGANGTGKTVSALLTAYGLCGDWSKIAVIDTEQNAVSYHSYLGRFHTLSLQAPYGSERLEKAVNHCEESGMEVIIIDSLSAEWVGEGGVLDLYQSTPGSETDKYREAMGPHHLFKAALLESAAHIIVTVRSKREYPFKILQDEELLNVFTAVVKIDEQSRVRVIKDHTTLLTTDEPYALTPETGQQLGAWCRQGSCTLSPHLRACIEACQTHEELSDLFHAEPRADETVLHAFVRRRQELDRESPVCSGRAIVRDLGAFPTQPAC